MIEKIGHYSITNPATVIDEEALTALQLAGRTAAKVNECVDAFNSHEKYVERRLDTQDAEIPKKVDAEVKEYVEDGRFDKAIATYAGELDKRVDNLLGSVSEGSTTLDAEVIDVRVGASGNTYLNAGEAVRGEVQRAGSGSFVYLNSPITVNNDGNVISVIVPDATVYYLGKPFQIINKTASYNHTDQTLFMLLYETNTDTVFIQHYSSLIPRGSCLVGLICDTDVYVNGAYNPDKHFIDGMNPLHPFVWSDEVLKFSITYDDESLSTKINVNIPTYYIQTGKRSLTVTESDLEVYIADEIRGLYKLIYNTSTKQHNVIYHGDVIPSGFVYVATISAQHGAWFNGMSLHATERSLALAPILLGWGNTFVAFDSSAKTVTFPRDSHITVNRHNGTKVTYAITTVNDPLTVSYADMTTSALILKYSISSGAVSFVPYNTRFTDDDIAIAVLRTTGAVSILCPYTWDGKPFNIDIKSYLPETIPVEARTYNVKSIAHRGYNTVAPENTLAAYREAAKRGFKYVECDLRFTSDGYAVLLHDDTIDRTSDGTGTINEMEFEYVREFDFGSWKDSKYTGEKIPRLNEFMMLCRDLGVHPYIEVKDMDGLIAYEGECQFYTSEYTLLVWLKDIVRFANAIKSGSLELLNLKRVGVLVNSTTDLETDEYYDTLISLKGLGIDLFVNINIESMMWTDDNGTKHPDSYIFEMITPTMYNTFSGVEVWTVNSEGDILALDERVSGISSDSLHAGEILYNNAINS